MRVGIISDTHGFVDPRLAEAFAGVEAIVHAGDVGGAHVIDALRSMAPLHAVYGNNDEKRGGLGLPLHADFTLAGVRFHLVHQAPYARPGSDTQVVVCGHSHRPLIARRDGRLHVNPGAAGRVGFHRLQTVAVMEIVDAQIVVRIVELGARETIQRTRGAR
jgi:putative phosphoesterase